MRLPNNPILLPPLPFHPADLEPLISQDTILAHYEGHHAGYVKKYNQLLQNPDASPEDLLFNFCGHRLHTLYWETLVPGHHHSPWGNLLEASIAQWGPNFRLADALVEEAVQIKGSGWVLLLIDKRGLFIKSIKDHNIPAVEHFMPIVVIDCWEHAWYLDYAFRKKEFFESCKKLINWDVAEARFAEFCYNE